MYFAHKDHFSFCLYGSKEPHCFHNIPKPWATAKGYQLSI